MIHVDLVGVEARVLSDIRIDAVNLENADIVGPRRRLVDSPIRANFGIGREEKLGHRCSSIGPRFGRNRLDLVGQGVQMHCSVIEAAGT